MTDQVLRVLYVIPGPAEGSSMVFAKRQVRAVERLGVRISTFHLESRTNPVAVVRAGRRLREVVRAFRPHVVHAQFGTMTALLTVATVRQPVVITYYGGDLNRISTDPPIRAFVARVLSQLAARRAAGLVCVSEELRDRLWWRRPDVEILPTGVDTEIFKPGDRAAARAAVGWGSHERVVLFNAGWDPRRKRLDLAEAAVREARRLVGDVRFEVLDGTRPPDSIPTVMNAADCLLVTSDSEGSPTVVQEAIASNLPVVSVAVGDVPERLARLPSSRIADRDPEGLGRALADVLSAPRPLHDPAVVREVAVESVAARLVALYRRVRAGRDTSR